MTDKKLCLKQIPVSPEVYEQLQKLWNSQRLQDEHTPPKRYKQHDS